MAQDIIQAALDYMAEEAQVTIHLQGDEAFGGVAVRFGTITSVGQDDSGPYVTVYDMHDSAGFGPGPCGGQRNVHTPVPVSQIKLIKRYGAS